MQLKSILNRIQIHHGFVFGSIRLVEKTTRLLLEIEIRPRKGSCPLCSGCGNPGPGYDTLRARRFEFEYSDFFYEKICCSTPEPPLKKTS